LGPRIAEEIAMRKIVAGLYVSLDCVMEAPETWHFPYFNDEMGAAVASQMAAADTLLLGRRTYEEFAAYWADKGSDVDFADVINNTPKLVASTTLKSLDWRN
jgi:dihydrofolate reductase